MMKRLRMFFYLFAVIFRKGVECVKFIEQMMMMMTRKNKKKLKVFIQNIFNHFFINQFFVWVFVYPKKHVYFLYSENSLTRK